MNQRGTSTNRRFELFQRDALRQATPAFFVGGFTFVAATLRSGSPATGALLGTVATVILGLPLWVWWDASRLGLRRPVAWGSFVLFTSVIGATLYFLLRPSPSRQRECRACSKSVQEHFAACPWCGTPQEEPPHACPSCREELEFDWQFCPYCRTAVFSAEKPSSGPMDLPD